jgi:hypothetical protein
MNRTKTCAPILCKTFRYTYDFPLHLWFSVTPMIFRYTYDFPLHLWFSVTPMIFRYACDFQLHIYDTWMLKWHETQSCLKLSVTPTIFRYTYMIHESRSDISSNPVSSFPVDLFRDLVSLRVLWVMTSPMFGCVYLYNMCCSKHYTISYLLGSGVSQILMSPDKPTIRLRESVSVCMYNTYSQYTYVHIFTTYIHIFTIYIIRISLHFSAGSFGWGSCESSVYVYVYMCLTHNVHAPEYLTQLGSFWYPRESS